MAGTVLGFPELNPRGVDPHNDEYASFYAPTNVSLYSPVQAMGASGVDFNKNGQLDVGLVPRNFIEGAEVTLAGAGTTPVVIDGLWCPSEEITIHLGACCAPGTTRNGSGVCVDDVSMNEVEPAEPPIIRSMFASGNYAAVVANDRMYGFYVDDLVSADEALAQGRGLPRRCSRTEVRLGRCDAWVPEGKIRWAAMDYIATPQPGPGESAELVGANAETPCSGAAHQCGHVAPGLRRYGTVATNEVPNRIPVRGPNYLSATTYNQGQTPYVAIAISQRSGMTCDPPFNAAVPVPGGAEIRHTICPWAGADLYLGPATNIETGQLSHVPLVNTALNPQMGAVSSAAIAAFDTQNDGKGTALIAVVRRVSDNRLYWARCTDGGCGAYTRIEVAVNDPVVRADEEVAGTGVSLTVKRNANAPDQLVLAYGAKVALGVFAVRLETLELAAGVLTTTRHLQVTPPTTTPQNIRVPTDAPISISFGPNDRLVIASSETTGFKNFFAVGTADIFAMPLGVGRINVPAPQHRNYGIASMVWIPSRVDYFGPANNRRFLRDVGFVPTPVTNIALVYDQRPEAQAIRPDPRDAMRGDSRYTNRLSRRYVNTVRAFMLEPQTSVTMRFLPNVMGEPIEPRRDYDDTATIAYNLCVQAGVSSQGYRGGDLQPRGGGANGERIRCPGAMGWADDSALQNSMELRLDALEAGDNAGLDALVAEMVLGPSWLTAPPADPLVPVPNYTPSTDSCAAGAGAVGAYFASQIPRSSETQP